MSKNQIVDDFNNLFGELVYQLILICPKSQISENYDLVKIAMNRRHTIVIDLFVDYVLKFKRQIDDGDDLFFMGDNFSKSIRDMSAENADVIGKFFEFKDIWCCLSVINRQTVKDYMKLLCVLADNYSPMR